MEDDDDGDLGLSAMMARTVNAFTSRPSRSREGVGDGSERGSSRSRSRSSSILRKMKGSKKKDTAPPTPRRSKSRDAGFDDDERGLASRSKSVRRSKSRDAGFDDERSLASRSKSVRRSKSRDAGFDDDKSPASRKSMKSTRSRVAKTGKKKSEKSEKSSPSKTELTSHNSGSTGSKDNDEQSVARRKSKKKSKKIKRKKSGGGSEGSGSDEYTILSKQSTKSTKSSRSTMSSDRYKNMKNKLSKQYKETSSRVEAIREPILSNEGVVIKDEMDNLFPLPNSPGSNVGKATRKPNGANSDTEIAQHSQRSIGSAGNYGIMTNKAAEERAESALNRVAASKQMEMNNNNSGGSDASGGERKFARRLSNGSSRSKEQYQRLHRDSGLTSLTSTNDNDDDTRSFTNRRSQSKLTAMSAMHKQIDEYKVETENLQKRLYEALAEVEESNTNLRREKERAETAEGDLSGVKSKLEDFEDEKLFLIESVRDMEKAFAAKDERVEKLQEVVETQLDSVEFLEDKLNKTEEELILMDDEITELIDIVEEKNNATLTEQVKEVKSKGQGRVARMVSMREDIINRKDSIKAQKQESRRVLLNSHDNPKSADRSRMTSMMAPFNENQVDVEKLENELKTREANLKADKEVCDNREQRLDTWEKELFDLEDQLKNENEKIGVAKKEVTSENSEDESLIASLEEEKDRLRRIQIDNKSKLKKLEIENEDLRVKLDRVTKMATKNTKELPVKNSDLADALALVDIKNKVIQSLEEKIDRLGEKGDNDEEEGKDLLIRELQNQLVNSKKEANSLSSGSYVTRLKLEIKKLRQSVLDLKKKLKDEEATSRLNLQRKDDSMKLLEKQMQKFKIELERRDKREKNLGTEKTISNSDLQNHIEDLEDEISHWKSTNADLENEIESLKSRVDDQNDYYLSEDDINDDCSIGSLASVSSRMSLSVSHDDNFFLTDSTHSMSDMGDPSATPNRAIRTVSNLWSKMRNGPEPPNTNQAFPYAPGSLDD
jgi:chromosome segregation ATPase